MSGSHRAPTPPPAGAPEAGPGPYGEQGGHPSYGQPQAPYEVYQEPYGTPGQPYQQPYAATYETYGQPYETYGQSYQQPQEAYGQPYQQPQGMPEPHQQVYAPYEPQARRPYEAYEPQVHQPYEVYEPYEPYAVHGGEDEADGLYPAEPEPAFAAAFAPAAEPVFAGAQADAARGVTARAGTAQAAGPAGPPAPRSAGRRRKAKKKTHGRALTAGTALLVAAAAGWYTLGSAGAPTSVSAADGAPEPTAAPDQAPAGDRTAGDTAHTGTPAADRSQSRADGSLTAIPGLGAAFTARIPATTNQVVLASGKGKDANDTTVTLWTRTAEGRWLAGEAWAGHNAYKGWTTDHNEGDLRSPIGVFTLTDAGGRDADPGSKLPYDKDSNFVVGGTGFQGEPLAGSFDYVIAINYNRVPGNSPLDKRRPDGGSKGGGIWIHVDHGGPTHGCVSVPEDKMAVLLRTLDPAANPVIVMGDAASLAA